MHLHLPHGTSIAHQWKALEQTFLANSQAQIMDLRLKMQPLKKNDLILKAYTLKLKSIIDNLLAIGESNI